MMFTLMANRFRQVRFSPSMIRFTEVFPMHSLPYRKAKPSTSLPVNMTPSHQELIFQPM